MLTGGTLNFGINSLTNYGRISVAAPVALTGTVSANFNGGYCPVTSNSFPVLTYPSPRTGIFTQTDLPTWIAWQTNYTATTFSLNVSNVQPRLVAMTNQVVDELVPLTITNSVIHNEPWQTNTFGLVQWPSGMEINTNSGVITWTPTEAQGPSNYTVVVAVWDNGTPWMGDTNSFEVVVQEVNVAPVLSVPTNQTINEMTALTNVVASAADSDIPANRLTFSLGSTNGMSINPPTARSPGRQPRRKGRESIPTGWW